MKRRKFPLTLKLAISMIIIVVGMLLFNYFLNDTFLEEYYISNKEDELQAGYERLAKAYETYEITSETYAKIFQNTCATGNYSVLIIKDNNKEWISSSSIEDFQYQIETIQYSNNSDSATEVLVQKTNFRIVRQVDNRSQVEYLILTGLFDNETFIFMRTPLESIRESADIAMKFFFMVGGMTLVLCLLVIVLVSKSIAKPIRRLSDISKQMKNLDFDVKYKEGLFSPRELDELGNNMNEMSKTLEENILELKAANLQLQRDLAYREEVDDMRKEFLSNVSHELKTPLALIQGYSEGLKECIFDDDESRAYYCDVIMDETQKMNVMVRKLLSLNQLEFGNNMLEITHFDLTELISGKIKSLEGLCQEKNIDFEFQELSCIVTADEYMVEEVITNYLTNAINHVEGERVIKVSYEFENEIVRICVYNTGNSIPEEDLEHIWEKFYKVDKARTRAYGGNGIGLSIVKAIMERHSQKYGVKNCENGVLFWFELECVKKA